jgi:hypothetical protein
VDLGNVITTLAGGDIAGHPAAAAVAALRAALDAGDLQGAAAALEGVQAALDAAPIDSAEANQVGVVLHQAAQSAVRCLVDATPGAPDAQAAALRALRRLLPLSPELRQAFRREGGAPAVAAALAAAGGDDDALAAAALEAAAAGGVKDEEGKAALVEAGLGEAAVRALEGRGEGSVDCVRAACALLCTLTNPDDESKPSSR